MEKIVEIREALGKSFDVIADENDCKVIYLWIDAIHGKILAKKVWYFQGAECICERKASYAEAEKCYKIYESVLRKVGSLENAYGTWKIESLEPYKGLDIEKR